MNRYKLLFYNSGGFSDSEIIETSFDLKFDSNEEISVLDNGKVIGEIYFLEEMLNEYRGWTEDNMVYDFKKLKDSKDK